MNEIAQKVLALSDGLRKSREIAAILGIREKQVQKLWIKFDMPRGRRGQTCGEGNTAWKTGRTIDRCGYALVAAPYNHPQARVSPGKIRGRMFEHRLVKERELGRLLSPEEAIDHIDGCTLHNAPENLRVFPSNAEHLKATISGQVPCWSAEGLLQMHRQHPANPDRLEEIVPIHTHRENRARGDVRLLQILRAHALLGRDSPFLLGTAQHLEKVGIHWDQEKHILAIPEDRRWLWVLAQSKL